MGARGSALAAAALFVAACAGTPAPPPSPPTEAAARAYLDAVVALVASGDPFAICEVGSSTCEQTIRKSDLAAVPSSAPTVIGSRVIEPTRLPSGIWNQGGRVLELCGRDGLDQPYYSEMLVFDDGGRLISTATPYWLGIRIAESPVVGGPEAHPACPSG